MSTSVTTTTSAVATRLNSIVGERRSELALLGVTLVLTFALVSLAGADAHDPTVFQTGSGRVTNPCGTLGAHVAHILRAGFGLGAWGIVLLLSVTMVRLAGRTVADWKRWVGAVITYGAVLGLMHVIVGDVAGYPAGGMVGTAIGGGVQGVAGFWGALFVLASVLVLGGTGLFRVRWRGVAAALVEGVEARGPVVRDVGSRAVSGATQLSARTARGTAALVWSTFAAGGRGVGDMLGRMWESVRGGDAGEWEVEDVEDVFDPTTFGGEVGGIDPNLGYRPFQPRHATNVDGEAETVIRPPRPNPAAEASTANAAPARRPQVREQAREYPATPNAGEGSELLDLFPEFGERRARQAVNAPQRRRSKPVASTRNTPEARVVNGSEPMDDNQLAQPDAMQSTPKPRSSLVIHGPSSVSLATPGAPVGAQTSSQIEHAAPASQRVAPSRPASAHQSVDTRSSEAHSAARTPSSRVQMERGEPYVQRTPAAAGAPSVRMVEPSPSLPAPATPAPSNPSAVAFSVPTPAASPAGSPSESVRSQAQAERGPRVVEPTAAPVVAAASPVPATPASPLPAVVPEAGGAQSAPIAMAAVQPAVAAPTGESPTPPVVVSAAQPAPPQPVVPEPSAAAVAAVPAPVVPVPAPAATPPMATPGQSGPSLRGAGITVHRAAYLDDKKVEDDGEAVVEEKKSFHLPTLRLLDEVPEQDTGIDEAELREMAATVEEKLLSFKIGGEVTAVRPGPVVTIFEFEPAAGIKVSRIAGLSDDLAMALRAVRVRIVAPIPGKGCVGIEIPSAKRLTIYLREVLASPAFKECNAALPCILGKDVGGKPVIGDLAKMPHLLIGGTTGAGKSVGVNGMLMSMLYTSSPDDLRMLLIDPKMLEFEMYEGIPHLLHPVVTDPKRAATALAWACREMDNRYEILARWGTRNIVSFNKKREKEVQVWNAERARKYAPKDWMECDGLPEPPAHMPYIVIVIDELADLMMVASKEVEESIARIAQKARACGIHLIVATQRPSVDVVTGLIKANLPTRISFQLRTRIDSRTVLDAAGAEALLGRGDMLYLPPGTGNLVRCHGAFVSDEEVARVTDFLRAQDEPDYIGDITDESANANGVDEDEKDELYDQAVQIVINAEKASTSMVQRHLKIGYNRAARIIDYMEAAGVIGPADGARPREVLV